MRVHLVQPVIPHYRIGFYRKLNEELGGRFAIWAARGVDDGLSSVSEAELAGIKVDLDCCFRPLLGGRLQRQTGLGGVFSADPDVLVLCGNIRYVSNLSLIARARRRRAGVVWWGHVASSTSSRPATALRKLLMRAADTVLVYTDAEREYLAARGFDSERLFYTNNALPLEPIDAARAEVTPEGLADWRLRFGLSAGDEVLLFTGRLTPKARLDVLIDALAGLAPLRPRLRAIIVGDGEMREQARAAALQAGVTDRLILTGAIFDEVALAHLFALADLYVYPGAVGLSLLHALYFGVPVVIHDQRRLHNPEADAFQSGINGVAFRKDDARSLAETLDGLLADQDRLARLRAAARGSVVPRFTIETMVTGFLGACAGAAARRGRQYAPTSPKCASRPGQSA